MSTEPINLLVTFDENYIPPFQTMLKSLVLNNPGEAFHVWLMHSAIAQEKLLALGEYCAVQGVSLTPLTVDRALFQNAPISRQYPQEMYYRLLAPFVLPDAMERILYLDPDILAINPLRPLWEIGLGACTFAAASHQGATGVMNKINRVRLDTEHDYYNSGVMLIDLAKARALVKPGEIFRCVSEHSVELVLPDQDVFNYLYGGETLAIDDAVWNYDARYYADYLLRSGGQYDLDWVMRNTVFLHFCGKRKPWKNGQTGRFAALYKHYMQLSARS